MARLDREELQRRLEFSERKRFFLKKLLAQRSVEEDTILWSWVDLMTLLLIFFILFYAQSITKTAPEKQSPSDRFEMPFNQPKQPALTPEASTPETLVESPKPELPPAVVSPQPVTRDESLEQLQRQVLNALAERGENGVSVRWDQRRLVLVLGERITFNVGEAELLGDFQPILQRIAGFIASKQGYQVVVAGHTDDTPISTPRFPSNWELSAARAVNVAKFLIANGVNPHRVFIEGHAEYRPLHENSTPENKQANRRVEITLIKEQESDQPS